MTLKHSWKYCGRPLLFDHFCRKDTPLIYSSAFGNPDVCRLLVDHKADVAARNRYRNPRAPFSSRSHALRCSSGRTALKCAIDNNEADVVAYLRSIGAPE